MLSSPRIMLEPGSMFVRISDDKGPDYLYDLESETYLQISALETSSINRISPDVAPYLFRIKDKSHRVEAFLSDQQTLIGNRCPFAACLIEEENVSNVTVTRFVGDQVAVLVRNENCY